MTRSVKPTSPPAPLAARSLGVSGRLEGVSLSLLPGRVLAVLGPNGAGKSTLVRALSGLLRPDQGQVLLGGEPIEGVSRRRMAQSVAVVPQQVEVPEGVSVRQVVASGRAPFQGALLWPGDDDRAAVDRALSRCDLAALAERPVDRLSGGELRRAVVARALAQSTPVLLLDEPVAHLDLGHAVALLSLLRRECLERGVAALLVIHDLVLAALAADDALVLSRGAVAAAGPAREVLTRAVLEPVFEVELAEASIDGVPMLLPRGPNFRPTS